ncbi:ferrochelatase [Sneathiella chinensis]|uniref:Ferrochelatase n=1 Tax=Sneathiella chinensis TaxID=349750 RepID=A0ABQ5TYN3_9PROT|nr:ferrochelatase [Sneathiella chinensis]GLQ04939.1 ferrochelatase [Sneathiella chinensis]
MARKAVVLFNLGGPDNLNAVEPFLFNLFNDPAIIRLPKPVRFLIAKLISKRRAPIAQEIYRKMGGASPLLDETDRQAKALSEQLATNLDGDQYQVFVAMRYWHPRADAVAREVKAYDPDEVILLPLYPQFSTTTSDSSLKEWAREADRAGISAATTTLCCYPTETGFISAYTDLIRQSLQKMEGEDAPRLLFSAHGLPKKIVDGGDPYQWQVEQTVAAIAAELAVADLDYRICYQSRVGPVEWIGPATEDEIGRAGEDGKSLLVVPVAFVSEHSETLVELDVEYAELAAEKGVPAYHRVPTVTCHPAFIKGLAGIVLNRKRGCHTSHCHDRLCPKSFVGCKTQPKEQE